MPKDVRGRGRSQGRGVSSPSSSKHKLRRCHLRRMKHRQDLRGQKSTPSRSTATKTHDHFSTLTLATSWCGTIMTTTTTTTSYNMHTLRPRPSRQERQRPSRLQRSTWMSDSCATSSYRPRVLQTCQKVAERPRLAFPPGLSPTRTSCRCGSIGHRTAGDVVFSPRVYYGWVSQKQATWISQESRDHRTVLRPPDEGT